MCAEHISRFSPLKFPLIHSIEKQPFFNLPADGGLPLFNGATAFIWFHGVLKMQNVYSFVAPVDGVPLESLFASKHLNQDGTESNIHVINEHFMALVDFYVACTLDASQRIKHEKMDFYHSQVAMYRALSSKGRNWRDELLACLKQWQPIFSYLLRKKRLRFSDSLAARSFSAEQPELDPQLF
jgi:hypothetical protein